MSDTESETHPRDEILGIPPFAVPLGQQNTTQVTEQVPAQPIETVTLDRNRELTAHSHDAQYGGCRLCY